MSYEPIDKQFIARNFNDRRVGGKPLGKGTNENPGYGHWPKDNRPPKGNGGVKAPRKPRGPHDPMPARAVAIKHEVNGY